MAKLPLFPFNCQTEMEQLIAKVSVADAAGRLKTVPLSRSLSYTTPGWRLFGSRSGFEPSNAVIPLQMY